MLSPVSLAHRGPRAEASHLAPPTRVPSVEWLPPTPQLRRAIVTSILILPNCDRKLFRLKGNDTSENSDILEVMYCSRNGKYIDLSKYKRLNFLLISLKYI